MESVIALATAATLVAGFMSARLHAQVDRADARIQQFELALRGINGLDGQLLNANAVAVRGQLSIGPLLKWSITALLALLTMSMFQVGALIAVDDQYSWWPDGDADRFDADTSGLILVFVATLVVVLLSWLDSGSLLHRLDELGSRNAALRFVLIFDAPDDASAATAPRDSRLLERAMRSSYRWLARKRINVTTPVLLHSTQATWSEIDEVAIAASAAVPSWKLPQLVRFCAAAQLSRTATGNDARTASTALFHAAHALGTETSPGDDSGLGFVLTGFDQVIAAPLAVADHDPRDDKITEQDFATDGAAPGQPPDVAATVGDLDVAVLKLLARFVANLRDQPVESARACGEMYRTWGVREPWLIPLWMAALTRCQVFGPGADVSAYRDGWLTVWILKLGNDERAVNLCFPDGVPDDYQGVHASNHWACEWAPTGLNWHVEGAPQALGAQLRDAMLTYAVATLERNRPPGTGLPLDIPQAAAMPAYLTEPKLAFGLLRLAICKQVLANANLTNFNTDSAFIAQVDTDYQIVADELRTWLGLPALQT